MSFTVRQLLESELRDSITIVSGNGGLDNCVSGVTIIEAPDIVHFIRGGELLLTGLLAFASCSTEEFKTYIYELREKHVSGIVLKPGRKVVFAEEKIAWLRQFSEENDIPLMEVPFEMSFQTILILVMEHLVNEEVIQLKYYKTTRDNFNALLMSPAFDGQRITDILIMLEKMIGGSVTLYRGNRVCCAWTGEHKANFAFREDCKCYEPGVFSTFEYFVQNVADPQYVIRFPMGTGEKVYLTVDGAGDSFGVMSCIAIENACMALQHEYARLQSMEELEKKFRSDILSGILHDKEMSAEDIRKNAAMIGLNPDDCYRVVSLGIRQEIWESFPMEEKLNHIKTLEELILREHPEDRTCRESDRILVVRKEERTTLQAEYRKSLCRLLEEMQRMAEMRIPGIHLQAGAGKQVDGIEQLSLSSREACDACTFIDVAGNAVGNMVADGDAQLVMFSDMGIFKLLCQITDPAELQEYVPESLQKLYDLKKSQRDELIETLKTYMECGRNLSQASKRLYIHYKTAAYRIDKISEITGINFDNAGEVLAVQIGLVVRQMVDNINKKSQR